MTNEIARLFLQRKKNVNHSPLNLKQSAKSQIIFKLFFSILQHNYLIHHPFFNHFQQLSPSCSNGSSIYRFNPQDIQYMLDLHNGNRNKVCNGSVPPFEPCLYMAKLGWDDELAYLSGLTTRSCNINYDSNRNTGTYLKSEN